LEKHTARNFLVEEYTKQEAGSKATAVRTSNPSRTKFNYFYFILIKSIIKPKTLYHKSKLKENNKYKSCYNNFVPWFKKLVVKGGGGGATIIASLTLGVGCV
jgi:hypothetical protein